MFLPETDAPPSKETYHQIIPHFILRQFHFVPSSGLYVLPYNMAEIRADKIGLDTDGRRSEIVGELVTYPAKNFSCTI